MDRTNPPSADGVKVQVKAGVTTYCPYCFARTRHVRVITEWVSADEVFHKRQRLTEKARQWNPSPVCSGCRSTHDVHG